MPAWPAAPLSRPSLVLLVFAGVHLCPEADSLQPASKPLFGKQKSLTHFEQSSRKGPALFGTVQGQQTQDAEGHNTVKQATLSLDRAAQEGPQSLLDCTGSNQIICQTMHNSLDTQSSAANLAAIASSQASGHSRVILQTASASAPSPAVPANGAHDSAAPAPYVAKNAFAPVPALSATAPAPAHNTSGAPSGQLSSKQALQKLSDILRDVQQQVGQLLQSASLPTTPQPFSLEGAAAIYAKLLAADMRAQTFPVAVDNTSVPSSMVQQSPAAGPTPMRRHLTQDPNSDSDPSTPTASSDDGDDSDIQPPSTDMGTSTDTATGMESSATTESSSEGDDTSSSSGGLQTTSATVGSASAPMNGSSSPGVPAQAPSGSSLTSVLTQPAVSFSSAFFATCNGSYACSTSVGLALSAAWIDNSTLLNAAFFGTNSSGTTKPPSIVSGLLGIGLRSADGTPADSIPPNSMHALLPLSSLYNTSQPLFCMEWAAEASLPTRVSQSQMSGAVVSCPALGPSLYFLAQGIADTRSAASGPSSSAPQQGSAGGTRAPAVYSKHQRIPRVAFTTTLAAWTLQTFDVVQQERFSDTLASYMPAAHLMVTLVDITAGSISFATNVDFLDGNHTAAEALANALQVSPDAVVPYASWNTSSFSSVQVLQHDNPFYAAAQSSDKRHGISGVGIGLIVIGCLLVVAAVVAGSWYGLKWRAKQPQKRSGNYQQYYPDENPFDARSEQSAMYNIPLDRS